MKEDFIKKWSNWWILNKNSKELNSAFEKELNHIIESERIKKCEHPKESVINTNGYRCLCLECGKNTN
jgi:hypothetical protein